MNSFTVITLRRNGSRPRLSLLTSTSSTRRLQSSLSALEETISKELLKRKTRQKWDHLRAERSSDLSAILNTHLPESCRVPAPPLKFRDYNPKRLLPQGHHQVYFNNLFAENHLFKDGTDRAHSPGKPFVRRLWAGGSLRFSPKRKWMLKNDNLGVLQENVESVKVKGEKGNEKVFVTISRKAAMYWAFPQQNNPTNEASNFPPDLRTFQDDLLSETGFEKDLGKLAMEETKTLVFMRAKTKEEIQQDLETTPKIIKPPHEPDFSIVVKPSPHLLFRFSMMTYNAHRIHLDNAYCREEEGYRTLLVHGPLTQVLMLAVLRSQLNRDLYETVYRFDYKNLAPLYVNEEMRICTRRRPDNPKMFDVWVEGKEGGYAVKATAEVGPQLHQDGNPLLNDSLGVSGEGEDQGNLVKRVTSTNVPGKGEEGGFLVKRIISKTKGVPWRGAVPELGWPRARDKREHFKQLIDVFNGTRTEANASEAKAPRSEGEIQESFQGKEESTNEKTNDDKK